MTTQGYFAGDIGQLKVDATRRAIELIDPTISVETLPTGFGPKQSVADGCLLLRR